MALDHSKLRQIKRRADGAYVAQCPACAGTGGDSRGEHLIIFPNGRFGCVAYPGESGREHRTEIAKIASAQGTGRVRQPTPAKLRLPKTESPRTLMVLGRLGRHNSHSQVNAHDAKNATNPRGEGFPASTPVPDDLKNTRPSRPNKAPSSDLEFLQGENEPAPLDILPPMTGDVAHTIEDVLNFLEE